MKGIQLKRQEKGRPAGRHFSTHTGNATSAHEQHLASDGGRGRGAQLGAAWLEKPHGLGQDALVAHPMFLLVFLSTQGKHMED